MDRNKVPLAHIITAVVIVLCLARAHKITALWERICSVNSQEPPFSRGQSMSAEGPLIPGHLSYPCSICSTCGSSREHCTLNSTFNGPHVTQNGFVTEMVTSSVRLFSPLRHCLKLCFLLRPLMLKGKETFGRIKEYLNCRHFHSQTEKLHCDGKILGLNEPGDHLFKM